MAKNKKKKEKNYGNDIAPISNKYTINVPTKNDTKKTTKTETKKSTNKTTKKEDKKKKKKKSTPESTKLSELVKSIDSGSDIAKGYDTEEYNKEYESLSKKQKAKANEAAAKSLDENKKWEVQLSREKARSESNPILSKSFDEQLKRQKELTFNPSMEDRMNIKENYGVSSEKNPYSKNYDKAVRENAVTPETKAELNKNINESILTGYLKNYYEQENQNPSVAEKILSPLTQAGTLFTGTAKLMGYQQYKDSKGLVHYLPDKLDLNYEKNKEKIDNKFLQWGYETGGEATKIIASSLLNIPTAGTAGTALYWSSMAGNNVGEATNKLTAKGEKRYDKVILNAGLKTALEYVTGKVLGSATKGLTGGKTSELESGLTSKLYDFFDKTKLPENLKFKLAKGLATRGSEGLEEFIQNPLESMIDILTLGDDGKHDNIINMLTDIDTWKDAFKAFASGAAVAGLVEDFNVVTNPGYYDLGAAELNKKKKSKNVQKIIDAEMENRIENEYNGNISAKEEAELQKEIISDIEKGYISTDTIEKTLGGKTYTELEKINTQKNDIQKQIDELERKAEKNELESLEEKQKLNDLKEQIKTIDDSEIRNRLNQEIQETIKNDSGLQESYKEVGRRTENYIVDLDSIQDEKQKEVYQKAMDSGVLNNSNKTHALVDMIAKISSDKNIDFDFTNNEQLEKSGFGVNGRNINGYVTDSGITINLNSSKAINRIVGHELTHTFEGTKLYTELQDSLKDFLGNEWAKQVAKYEELYKGVKNANVENELTSDLIGDYLFTDESFVRSLSTEHKNLFGKIYDEIKYLYRVATAGSKEKRQLEKVKRTFDRIYNETSSVVESKDAKYSITGIEGAKQLAKTDSNYQYVVDNYNTALELKKNNKKLTNEDVRQITGWFQDKYNTWKYEVSDDLEAAYLKETPEKNGSYNSLRDIFEHNILYKMYPGLEDVKLKFDDINAKGKYSKENNTIYINNDLINSYSDTIGTLLHEIQHYIQHNEPRFVSGTSASKGILRYLRRLGEIEAADTKNRRELTESERKSIAPETSKKNPVHPEREEILDLGASKLEKTIEPLYNKVNDMYEKLILAGEKVENFVNKNSGQDNSEIGKENENEDLGERRYRGVSNTSFSLSKDSQGRELTENQKEYFKNSKVVDDNGNLKVMYNGGGDYTTFDNTKMSDQSKWGKGIYLTEESDIARMYGDNVKEVYVDIENPINQNEKTIPFDKFNELSKALYDEEAYREEYDMYDNDLDLLWDATNKGNWADYGEQLRNIVGVDGLIIEDSNPAERMVIAFNSNQVKNVSNENPTSNPDIRYDLSVSEANTTEDNEGRKLSKDQLSYFKDSKAVDNDGNLITVYHTTTNEVAQFNEFNPVGTEYYRFGDQVVNYYTNSKEMSGSYANQDYVMADTKKINSMDEVNSLLEEHNNNLNPNEKYDYNLEIIKDEDGYKLKVTSQPGAAASGEIEEFYPRIYENQTDLFKKIKNDIMTYKTIRNENGMAISKNKKLQYEGYVNITNPYVVDAEKRNWNQVVSQSNEFIDELDERVPQDIKDNLTRLYRESENKSAELRDEFNVLENAIRGMWNSAVDEDIKKVNEVVKRVGFNEIEDAINYDGKMGVMGVNGWYNIAEVLEQQGIIGKSTAKLIIDDFKLPDSIKEYIQENYNKEIPLQMLWTNNASKLMEQLGKNTTLKDLYNTNQQKYLEFDKYRMPNNYFLEQISSEGNDYLGNDLNDMFETRAEIMSPERVAEEIAEAASVGFSKPEMIRLWGTSKTTNDIVKEVIASNNDGSTNYDGVIIRNVYDYGGKSEGAKTFNDLYITFNSNQFKAADNTNPTVDPDIRYSLSMDSQGRELSEEQQEYFKDSKVRDENGNLETVYHQTKNDFTEFKNGFSVRGFKNANFFTNQKPKQIFKNIMEGYVKIDNPLYLENTSIQQNIVDDAIANGYDGIINQNVQGIKGKNEIVTFSSNQFKNIDNLNPTDNPDIRYSLDIAPISKNFLTESEQKELDGLRAVDNSGFSELTPEEQSRMYELENRANTVLDKKAEKMLRSASYKAINTATKVAQNYLDFDAQEKKSFRNQLREFSNMTKDELIGADTYNKVKDIVSQYANREYTYFDDTVEGIKKELKHTKIKISDELKNQITDYGYFVRDSKLMLRRNSGTPVDQVYQEYSEMYPNFFDSEVWSEADQLERLNDFINHDFSVTEKYTLSDDDLRGATDLIYNKLLDNSLTQQDLIETEEILDKKVQKRTRSVVREELLQKMGITPELIGEGNDISAIDFARTDPVRVNEKVFGWKTGQLINDATVNFTKHQEAERMRFLNKERQEIKDLGIKARSKESELVQKYGEKQYVDKNNEVHPYTDAELNRDVKDAATREKIKNAARVLRQKYDTYIDRVNSVLTEMGYDEIPKRQDYMRHFVELDDKFSRWGLPFNKESMMAEDLPTDINGLTEFNRPGKSYFASANTRTGLQTTYDAITGIDGYLEGVSNLIYHTESIQRYRALTRFIRENYGREHGLDNIDLMTDEELAERIKDIQDNKLSKYVAWLDEQANSIAGKKGSLDRSVERMFGRRMYTALNTLKSQVGSNLTGFNVRSALTNIASMIQGLSKTQKLGATEGIVSTINNIVKDDGLIDKSDFLTRRFGSDSLAMKPWQKLSKAGQIFMEGTDWFTANCIWRGKYFENLHKGMSEQDAIKNADDFAARIMGDRSKGSTAELFNSKTLGFLSQFQLEVNNQWSSLIHDNKIDIQKGNKTALGVTFELGQLFAASYMFNTMMKALTGSDVMIDPIDMLLKIFKPKDDDKDEGIVKRAQKVLGEFINQLPFANLITGGGRIPISEAFTGAKTLGTKLMGGTDNYGNEITWGDVSDDLKESLAYWVLPTGYGQIRKTVKGLSMYDDKLPIAGSYTDSGNLRFSAEDTPFGKAKAALFGQYSSKYAQDYIDSGYKSINASKLDEMKDLDMNSTEYRDYREGLSAAGTSIEDKLNYISDLDVSDEDKTIMASNVAKKDIDMAEYKKFGSYEEFNYAQKNPTKYEVMKLVGGYDNYKKYEKSINEITADYDRNGKAITNSRKNKVIKYVNSLNLTRAQKAMIIKEQYPSFTQYDSQIASYINNQNISFIDKATILKQLGFKAYDSQIINYIKENYRTFEEQKEELEKLGFKIYNYNGRMYVR